MINKGRDEAPCFFFMPLGGAARPPFSRYALSGVPSEGPHGFDMIGKAAVMPGHESQFQTDVPGACVAAAVTAPKPLLAGCEIRGEAKIGVGKRWSQKRQQLRHGGQTPIAMAGPFPGVQFFDVDGGSGPVQRIGTAPILPLQAAGGIQDAAARGRLIQKPLGHHWCRCVSA